MMEQGTLSPFISVPDTIGELLAIGASVPIGTGGKVHVWGRNDMTTTQKLGIHWIVREPPTVEYPDGRVAQDYEDWEGWPNTSPGDDHEFISWERFDINKPGDWTISIGLFMNQDDPVMVDSYDGVLCRVTEEYAGTIIKKELDYDGVRGDIPIY